MNLDMFKQKHYNSGAPNYINTCFFPKEMIDFCKTFGKTASQENVAVF